MGKQSRNCDHHFGATATGPSRKTRDFVHSSALGCRGCAWRCVYLFFGFDLHRSHLGCVSSTASGECIAAEDLFSVAELWPGTFLYIARAQDSSCQFPSAPSLMVSSEEEHQK